MAKVFVIPDTHFPFHNKRALKAIFDLIKKEKPTHVVQIGDLLDLYGFSKYTKSLAINPQKEVEMGLLHARLMWSTIRKLAPKAKLVQVLGNHDIRMSKRISEKLPELVGIMDPLKIFTFPNVLTLKDERDFIDIEGVRYLHGYLSKSLDHAAKQGRPVVHGHRHRAEIATQGKLWSMDVGFLGDENKLPFQYTQSKTTNWTLACGIVENGKPRLILL